MKIALISLYSVAAFASLSASAHASKNNFFDIVSRCSHASKVVVDGYIKFEKKSDQSEFVTDIFKTLRTSRQLGVQTPDEVDELLAKATLETLVSSGVNPRSQRDWAIAQVSGVCSIKRFEAEQYRSKGRSSEEDQACQNKYSLGYVPEKCEK